MIIEAEQYVHHGRIVKGMCTDINCPNRSLVPHVHTIHKDQVVYIELGDWIIPEPNGINYYPCKPDIFEKTYEPA